MKQKQCAEDTQLHRTLIQELCCPHTRAPAHPPARPLTPTLAGKTSDKTATGLTYIPAPKLKLPGHSESYNPPKEYLPSEVCGWLVGCQLANCMGRH